MGDWRDQFSGIVSSCRDIVERCMNILKPDRKILEELKDKLFQVKLSFSKLYESVARTKGGGKEMEELQVMDSFGGVIFAVEGLLHSLDSVVEEGITFSDKAVGEVEELRVDISRILGDLEDLVKTYNKTLARALREEAKKVSKKADSFSLYHEERIVAGICMPKASLVYLGLLLSARGISYGVFRIAKHIEERKG